VLLGDGRAILCCSYDEGLTATILGPDGLEAAGQVAVPDGWQDIGPFSIAAFGDRILALRSGADWRMDVLDLEQGTASTLAEGDDTDPGRHQNGAVVALADGSLLLIGGEDLVVEDQGQTTSGRQGVPTARVDLITPGTAVE
jgi:hypothetical protein